MVRAPSADDQRAAAAASAAERAALRGLIKAFAQIGVRPLLLKGAALAYTVYPRPWLRPHSDIDLLIPHGCTAAVREMLGSRGFTADVEVSHPLVTTQSHYSMPGPLGLALDVHETLVNPYVFRSLPGYDELAARAQPIPALDPAALGLGTPDALLHALVHRVAHHNSSLDRLWLYDLELLAARMSDRDWQLLVRTAADAAVCAVAYDGLLLVTGSARERVPSWVRGALAEARGEPSAALLGGALTEWRLQWINFRALPGFRARLEFVRAHVAPPRSQLASPPAGGWQVPAHYVTRVVRGVRKWAMPISRCR